MVNHPLGSHKDLVPNDIIALSTNAKLKPLQLIFTVSDNNRNYQIMIAYIYLLRVNAFLLEANNEFYFGKLCAKTVIITAI